MVTELCSAQFWSEITRVFLSQIHAARSFDFEITHTISGLISHVQIFQHAHWLRTCQLISSTARKLELNFETDIAGRKLTTSP